MALAYLADVVELERLWHEWFRAADSKPLDLAALAAVPESAYADLLSTLHPTMLLLHSDYPVHRIWNRAQQCGESGSAVDLNEGPAWLLVACRGIPVGIQSIDEAEWIFLDSFRRRSRRREGLGCPI